MRAWLEATRVVATAKITPAVPVKKPFEMRGGQPPIAVPGTASNRATNTRAGLADAPAGLSRAEFAALLLAVSAAA